MNAVLKATLTPPPPDPETVMRYARGRLDAATKPLLDACVREATPLLQYAVCYLECDVTVSENEVDLGALRIRSADLAAHLQGRARAVIFTATVGAGVDRLIARTARTSPAKALLFDALATERVEALCDAFTARYTAPHRRFSPGYGDLPLEFQRDIFAVLDCPRRIGVTLCENLLMVPTKSVSAIVGVEKQ